MVTPHKVTISARSRCGCGSPSVICLSAKVCGAALGSPDGPIWKVGRREAVRRRERTEIPRFRYQLDPGWSGPVGEVDHVQGEDRPSGQDASFQARGAGGVRPAVHHRQGRQAAGEGRAARLSPSDPGRPYPLHDRRVRRPEDFDRLGQDDIAKLFGAGR